MDEPKIWKPGPGRHKITILQMPMYFEHFTTKQLAREVGLPVWECPGVAICPICQFEQEIWWPVYFQKALARMQEWQNEIS